MKNLALSPVATGLIRALIARSDVPKDRIYLIDCQSIDWQSLTFTGERHVIRLRVAPPNADAICARMLEGIREAEVPLRGHFLAEIDHAPPLACSDGSIELTIEALTVAEA